MSRRLHPRRRKHADAARDVLLELVESVGLVVEDPALAARVGGASWSRYSHVDVPGTPWPEGEFTSVAVRLPRSKGALDLALNGAADVLVQGGTLWLYGANDEGIRSAPKRLAGLFEIEDTVAKRHSRVYRCVRTDAVPKALAAWRQSVPAPEGVSGSWVTYPGVFAKGRVDAGTAALLDAVPDIEAGAHVLDFACGIGVIAGSLSARQPDARFTALDNDAISLLACAENVPEAARVLSDGWRELAPARYDLIVSNPPFHAGKDEDFGVIRSLVDEAPRFLAPSGELWIVCQRQVPLAKLFEHSPLTPTAAASGPRFTVWRASR